MYSKQHCQWEGYMAASPHKIVLRSFTRFTRRRAGFGTQFGRIFHSDQFIAKTVRYTHRLVVRQLVRGLKRVLCNLNCIMDIGIRC